MGIFDKFKKKPAAAPKVEKPSAGKKASAVAAASEEKTAAVVTPDGRLVAAAKKPETKAKKAKIKKEDTGLAYRFLLRPLITEKGSSLGVFNQYAFEASSDANKTEIKKAIKKVYGVDPVKINIINVYGKKVRYGRTDGSTKNWKKAIVTLPAGQKIDIQEGL